MLPLLNSAYYFVYTQNILEHFLKIYFKVCKILATGVSWANSGRMRIKWRFENGRESKKTKALKKDFMRIKYKTLVAVK